MPIHGSLPRLLAIASLAVGFAFTIRADENLFGYSYGSETLPAGHSELYQWVTQRSGKASGGFESTDLQTEFEYGFTDRLQGSLYLNGIDQRVSGVNGLSDQNHFGFDGLQASLKYSVLSPYKDGLGLAFYLEPAFHRYAKAEGSREDAFSVEAKVILQKNFADDAVIWVTNLAIEPERSHLVTEGLWESELETELTSGLAYRLAPGWYAGIEGRAQAVFANAHIDALENYALFAGPSLHYGGPRFWATLTVLPQLTGWPANRGGLQLGEFERIEYRLKVGLDF